MKKKNEIEKNHQKLSQAYATLEHPSPPPKKKKRNGVNFFMVSEKTGLTNGRMRRRTDDGRPCHESSSVVQQHKGEQKRKSLKLNY